jgi:hypothetical protein
MPDAGRTHGPPATRKAGGSDQRFSQNNRHSLRNGFRLIRALPGVPGLLAPVALRNVLARLDTSVGVSGPRDFAVRFSALRLVRANASIASRLTFRDDRPTRPSCRGEMWANVQPICYFGNTEMVRQSGTTGNSRMAAMCELPVRRPAASDHHYQNCGFDF